MTVRPLAGLPVALFVCAVAIGACTSEPATDPSTVPSSAVVTSVPTTVTTTTATSMTVAPTTVTSATVTSTTVTSTTVTSTCGGASTVRETFAYDEIDGVEPDLVSLDVYRPTTGTACPIVVWVHGGGWQVGDKAVNSIETKATHFTGQGSVFVSINYRLASPGSGVTWPAMGEDVAAAVAWVLENAASIGGDATRLTLIGHSAGAHLVTLVATSPGLLGAHDLTRDSIACVVSLDSAAYDLRTPMNLVRPLIVGVFGDDPEVLDAASPLHEIQVHGGPVADHLVVTRGMPNREAMAAQFSDAVAATGAVSVFLDASPLSHEDINLALGDPSDEIVTPAVDAFVSDCLSAA